MLQGLAEWTRVLYLDPKGGEYQFGFPVRTFEEIQKVFNDLHGTNGEGYESEFVLRVVKPDAEAATWICQIALQESIDGPVIVAVDEIQRYSNRGTNLPGFELIQDEGGWRGVSLVGTAHRPVDVHPNLLAAADRIVIFQTHHLRDVDRIQDYIDVPRESIVGLAVDEYIDWRVGHGWRLVKRGK